MSFFSGLARRRKTLVGVDIGTSSIKVVGLRRHSEGYELECLGIEKLPPDAVVDGVVISKPVVAETIDRIFKAQKIRQGRIAASVCRHSVIVKRIKVPRQSLRELEDSIQWEAKQHVPFNISDVNLDYHVLHPPMEGHQMHVLLVAAKRDQVQEHSRVFAMAGKRTTVIDVDVFALQNAFEWNHRPQPNRVSALVGIGAAITNVNIVKGTSLLFSRDIALGGNRYTKMLAKELNVSFDEAEQLKVARQPSPPHQAERTTAIVRQVSEIFVREIQRTLDFSTTTIDSQGIGQIVLSGGASRTQGLCDLLEERLRIPVAFLNPFQRISIGKVEFPSACLESHAADFAVGVGLALRCEH